MEYPGGKAEEYLHQLCAIEPVYHQDYGDACHIYLADGGKLLDKRSIRGIKQALAKVKALNQVYLRSLCGEQLERRLNLPIPLAANLILVPLKTRQPLTGNDSAYGLVNLAAVRRVVSGAEGGALLVLSSGDSLKVLANRETALAHLAEGVLLQRHFVSNVWVI